MEMQLGAGISSGIEQTVAPANAPSTRSCKHRYCRLTCTQRLLRQNPPGVLIERKGQRPSSPQINAKRHDRWAVAKPSTQA
jgi:hypothetical protein